MNFIIKLILSALAIAVTSLLLPGVHVHNFFDALLVAAVLTLLNQIVKPILIILTIPITVLTLGLFLLVINAILILITSSLIDGFMVDGFWWALLFSILTTIIASIFQSISKKSDSK
ncbi:MAG: phage holin family protein [Bacteroidota bacterium]